MPLNEQQKQLVFDYTVARTGAPETAAAAGLIESNPEAAKIHGALKRTLAPLESLGEQACPDHLAEGTVWRLKSVASATPTLSQLLADEQARRPEAVGRPWQNIGRMAATAAVIVLMASALFAPLRSARERSWQQLCQMQLGGIWQGMTNYCNDHDGRMPAVPVREGEPWWKVGYPGEENHSNTRRMWLLVRDAYVEPSYFVCPGIRHGRAIQIGWKEARSYNDFPARRYVTYSVRIQCSKSARPETAFRKVLIADMNPLFESIPEDFSRVFHVRCDEQLLSRNSSNHNGRGQSILMCDGSVKFVRNRLAGIAADDIFTLRGTSVYRGVEVPSCETDAFLAP
jgi:hypothetical protein